MGAKRIPLIRLNVYSPLSKIDEIWYITAYTISAITEIFESKLDETILQLEIQLSSCELLRCDRNRNGWGIACYIRSDISYLQQHVFPSEIKNFFCWNSFA